MFNNRYKYKFKSPLGPYEPDNDPIGWDKVKAEVGRSETTFGMFLSVTNNLQFTGKLKKYLEDNYLVYGVQAKVQLTVFKRHPKTDEWQLEKTGYLDFGTRKVEENKLKLDFVEGGLRELLVSQMREKFEVDRKTDIKGNLISPFKPDTLNLKGREIFLASKFSGENTQSFYMKSGSWKSQGDDRYSHRPFPMVVTANSDPDNLVPPVESVGSHGQYLEKPEATTFLRIASRDFGRTKFKLKASFRIAGIDEDAVRVPVPRMNVILRKWSDQSATGGSQFTLESPDIELVNVGNPIDQVGQTFTIDYSDDNFQVKKGESFAILIQMIGVYGTDLDSGYLDVLLDNYSASMSFDEDSFFKSTTSSFITAFDLGNRLTEIFSGKPAFRSKLLSGKWRDLGFTCGFWLRNMLKYSENEEEQDEARTMTMNFEEYYKSIHAVEPVGYGVVTEGNNQYIVLESLRYFFQPVTTIRLGKVSKIKRRTAMERVFSSVTTGYTKGGNYEKPLGLDEYNIQANHISPITIEGANKYEVLGPSRTDSYAVEDTRRKPAELYPEEDTPYDRDPFLVDAKWVNGLSKKVFEPRLWQDDFETAPTGIYSPETAFNLRLSPGHNRERHAIWFNCATVKLPKEKLMYATNDGNSKLTTKRAGKPALKENEDVLIQDLSNPIAEPEWIEFELPFTQEVKEQIMGKTKVGEEWINNFYGLVEFINEKNKKEKAYLFTSKIEDKITFKTLKAYGV